MVLVLIKQALKKCSAMTQMDYYLRFWWLGVTT